VKCRGICLAPSKPRDFDIACQNPKTACSTYMYGYQVQSHHLGSILPSLAVRPESCHRLCALSLAQLNSAQLSSAHPSDYSDSYNTHQTERGSSSVGSDNTSTQQHYEFLAESLILGPQARTPQHLDSAPKTQIDLNSSRPTVAGKLQKDRTTMWRAGLRITGAKQIASVAPCRAQGRTGLPVAGMLMLVLSW